ncbi:MAG: hypothetical protein ABIT37_17930 [Luteolibacter sp.]
MGHFTESFLVILLFVVLPVAFVSAVFYLARIVKAGWIKGGLTLLGIVLSLGITFYLVNVVPYFWAGHLEAKWTAAHPKTRVEMESYLSLCTMREIQPAQSGWGRNHPMQDGDKMIQYLLFWTQPLEVVYDKNDRMIASYTSYE